jgi:hypothetical protein
VRGDPVAERVVLPFVTPVSVESGWAENRFGAFFGRDRQRAGLAGAGVGKPVGQGGGQEAFPGGWLVAPDITPQAYCRHLGNDRRDPAIGGCYAQCVPAGEGRAPQPYPGGVDVGPF